jgi:hypothetical protein
MAFQSCCVCHFHHVQTTPPPKSKLIIDNQNAMCSLPPISLMYACKWHFQTSLYHGGTAIFKALPGVLAALWYTHLQFILSIVISSTEKLCSIHLVAEQIWKCQIAEFYFRVKPIKKKTRLARLLRMHSEEPLRRSEKMRR